MLARVRASAVLAAAALAALATLAATGCGEDRPANGRVTTTPTPLGTTTASAGKAVESLDVSLSEYRLDPDNPRVARAGLVAFVATDDGEARHALRVDGPTGEVTTPTLRPGEQATITVRLPPGTYKWYCPIADHERRGMSGRVRVAE
jgi:plastocyanin